MILTVWSDFRWTVPSTFMLRAITKFHVRDLSILERKSRVRGEWSTDWGVLNNLKRFVVIGVDTCVLLRWTRYVDNILNLFPYYTNCVSSESFCINHHYLYSHMYRFDEFRGWFSCLYRRLHVSLENLN